MNYLKIAGLIFNTLGAFILAIPLLKIKVYSKEYEITESGKEGKDEFWFMRGLYKKNRSLALRGIGLMIFGFILQLFEEVL